MNETKERHVAWAMLILCPLSMSAMFAYVTLGHAQGLAAGHPVEYLQMTCLLWAIIMVIIPILRLTRMVTLPYWFSAILYFNMYMYVISLCHGMYFDVWWWANFTHIVSSAVVGAIILMALCLMQSHSPPHLSLGSRGGIVAVLVLATFCFGVVWEIMEGFTEILTGTDYMSYGATHTLFNLSADLLGAAIMGAIAWVILGRRTVDEIVSDIRLGKKNIDATTR